MVQLVLDCFYLDMACVESAEGLWEGDLSRLTLVEPVTMQQRWIMSFIACNSLAVALWCDSVSVKAVVDALI